MVKLSRAASSERRPEVLSHHRPPAPGPRTSDTTARPAFIAAGDIALTGVTKLRGPDRPVHVTPQCGRLLKALMLRAGQMVPHDVLLRSVRCSEVALRRRVSDARAALSSVGSRAILSNQVHRGYQLDFAMPVETANG